MSERERPIPLFFWYGYTPDGSKNKDKPYLKLRSSSWSYSSTIEDAIMAMIEFIKSNVSKIANAEARKLFEEECDCPESFRLFVHPKVASDWLKSNNPDKLSFTSASDVSVNFLAVQETVEIDEIQLSQLFSKEAISKRPKPLNMNLVFAMQVEEYIDLEDDQDDDAGIVQPSQPLSSAPTSDPYPSGVTRGERAGSLLHSPTPDYRQSASGDPYVPSAPLSRQPSSAPVSLSVTANALYEDGHDGGMFGQMIQPHGRPTHVPGAINPNPMSSMAPAGGAGPGPGPALPSAYDLQRFGDLPLRYLQQVASLIAAKDGLTELTGQAITHRIADRISRNPACGLSVLPIGECLDQLAAMGVGLERRGDSLSVRHNQKYYFRLLNFIGTIVQPSPILGVRGLQTHVGGMPDAHQIPPPGVSGVPQRGDPPMGLGMGMDILASGGMDAVLMDTIVDQPGGGDPEGDFMDIIGQADRDDAPHHVNDGLAHPPVLLFPPHDGGPLSSAAALPTSEEDTPRSKKVAETDPLGIQASRPHKHQPAASSDTSIVKAPTSGAISTVSGHVRYHFVWRDQHGGGPLHSLAFISVKKMYGHQLVAWFDAPVPSMLHLNEDEEERLSLIPARFMDAKARPHDSDGNPCRQEGPPVQNLTTMRVSFSEPARNKKLRDKPFILYGSDVTLEEWETFTEGEEYIASVTSIGTTDGYDGLQTSIFALTEEGFQVHLPAESILDSSYEVQQGDLVSFMAGESISVDDPERAFLGLDVQHIATPVDGFIHAFLMRADDDSPLTFVVSQPSPNCDVLDLLIGYAPTTTTNMEHVIASFFKHKQKGGVFFFRLDKDSVPRSCRSHSQAGFRMRACVPWRGKAKQSFQTFFYRQIPKPSQPHNVPLNFTLKGSEQKRLSALHPEIAERVKRSSKDHFLHQNRNPENAPFIPSIFRPKNKTLMPNKDCTITGYYTITVEKDTCGGSGKKNNLIVCGVSLPFQSLEFPGGGTGRVKRIRILGRDSSTGLLYGEVPRPRLRDVMILAGREGMSPTLEDAHASVRVFIPISFELAWRSYYLTHAASLRPGASIVCQYDKTLQLEVMPILIADRPDQEQSAHFLAERHVPTGWFRNGEGALLMLASKFTTKLELHVAATAGGAGVTRITAKSYAQSVKAAKAAAKTAGSSASSAQAGRGSAPPLEQEQDASLLPQQEQPQPPFDTPAPAPVAAVASLPRVTRDRSHSTHSAPPQPRDLSLLAEMPSLLRDLRTGKLALDTLITVEEDGVSRGYMVYRSPPFLMRGDRSQKVRLVSRTDSSSVKPVLMFMVRRDTRAADRVRRILRSKVADSDLDRYIVHPKFGHTDNGLTTWSMTEALDIDLQRWIESAAQFITDPRFCRPLYRMNIDILRDTLRGTHFLHKSSDSSGGTDVSVAHRDLKPANVFIRYRNMSMNQVSAVIGDVETIKSSADYRKTTRPILTHDYAAPEYTQYARRAGGMRGVVHGLNYKAVDVWAIGLICWEMFALSGINSAGKLMSHYARMDGARAEVKINRIFLQTLSQQRGLHLVEDFISRCLQLVPAQRPSVESLFSHPLLMEPARTLDCFNWAWERYPASDTRAVVSFNSRCARTTVWLRDCSWLQRLERGKRVMPVDHALFARLLDEFDSHQVHKMKGRYQSRVLSSPHDLLRFVRNSMAHTLKSWGADDRSRIEGDLVTFLAPLVMDVLELRSVGIQY